jgi:hypothetical protein
MRSQNTIRKTISRNVGEVSTAVKSCSIKGRETADQKCISFIFSNYQGKYVDSCEWCRLQIDDVSQRTISKSSQKSSEPNP